MDVTELPIAFVSWGELQVVAILNAAAALVGLSLREAPTGQAPELVANSPSAEELHRAVLRAVRGVVRHNKATLQKRLDRVCALWQQSRPNASIVQDFDADTAAAQATPPAPRIFVDRIGSNFIECSWEPLGGVGDTASEYEVEVAGFLPSREKAPVHVDHIPSMQRLGSYVVSGGATRQYTLRRLRQLSYHRVRVRALGPNRLWVSAWSIEVSAKTTSLEDARLDGRPISSEGFMARSERRVCKAVEARSRSASVGSRHPWLPSSHEVHRIRDELIGESLDDAFGPVERVDKHIFDARKCADLGDYLRLGWKYRRPADSNGDRLQRMRLVLAAQELYDPSYPATCPWSMGPLYYEETGHKAMQATLGGA